MTSATDQRTIVLIKRKTKVDRVTVGFVSACSSVTGMHPHHLEGWRCAQDRQSRFAKSFPALLIRLLSCRAENDAGHREKQSRARSLAGRSSYSASRRRRCPDSRCEDI